MLKSKRLFSKVITSSLLLVWHTQLSPKKVSNQCLTKWLISTFWKLTFLPSIWLQNNLKPLETNLTWHLVTMIETNIQARLTGTILSINICLVSTLKTFFSMVKNQVFVIKKTRSIDVWSHSILEHLWCQCQNMLLITWVRKVCQPQIMSKNAIVKLNTVPWLLSLEDTNTNFQMTNGCSQPNHLVKALLLKAVYHKLHSDNLAH